MAEHIVGQEEAIKQQERIIGLLVEIRDLLKRIEEKPPRPPEK